MIKGKRKKAGFWSTLRNYRILRTDLKWIDKKLKENGKLTKEDLGRYTFNSHLAQLNMINSYAFPSFIRKMALKRTKYLMAVLPYEVNEYENYCKKEIEKWLENGIQNEDVKIGEYYKVVSRKEIHLDFNCEWSFSEWDNAEEFDPYIIKITDTVGFADHDDCKRSKITSPWYFRGITKLTVNQKSTVYASQLEPCTKEEVEEMERERRSILLRKLRQRMTFYHDSLIEYARVEDILSEQLRHSDYGTIPLLKEPTPKNYFEITKSL